MTEESASPTAAKLEATRARLKGVVEPTSVRPPRPFPSRVRTGIAPAGISLKDSVVEGIEQWWRKSTAGRAFALLGPIAEPHLRPIARRHYQALLLTSAAAGALVSHYPGRSARAIVRVAGPVLISGVILEIARAGFRQMRGKSPPAI